MGDFAALSVAMFAVNIVLWKFNKKILDINDDLIEQLKRDRGETK